MNNAFTVKQELDETMLLQKENNKSLRGIHHTKTVFSVATYFIYLVFTSVLFAGVSIWGLQAYIVSNGTNVIALVWLVFAVLGIPLAISLAKHFNYSSITDSFEDKTAIRKVVIRHALVMLILMVVSGVYYETIAASSNQQDKAFKAVDYKGNLNAIISGGGNVQQDSGLNNQIAQAGKVYNGCLVKLEEAKRKNPNTKFHCNGDKSAFDSLKEQANAGLQAGIQASASAVEAKGDLLNDAVDNQAIPPAKFISELLGVSISTGVTIIAIIAALLFEAIHITTIYTELTKRVKRKAYMANLKVLNAEYYELTGKVYAGSDFKDGRVIDLSDKPLSEEHMHNTPPPAPEKTHSFGFVPQNRNGATLPPTVHPSSKTYGYVKPAKQYGYVKPQTPENIERVDTQHGDIERVDTQHGDIERVDTQPKRVDSMHERVELFNPVYRIFSDLPVYPTGFCKWCGTSLDGRGRGAKFCSDKHRYDFHNLKNPPSKSARVNHS